MAHSSHNEILSRLKADYPELQWRTATDVETVDLLDLLASSEIDFTILDSNEYIANGFYPRLNIAFEIGHPSQLAWALRARLSPGLNDLAAFFKNIHANGTQSQLEEFLRSQPTG